MRALPLRLVPLLAELVLPRPERLVLLPEQLLRVASLPRVRVQASALRVQLRSGLVALWEQSTRPVPLSLELLPSSQAARRCRQATWF